MEVWKDIPGYEGLYQVSNLGNVKSLSRLTSNIKGSYFTKEKILKLNINTNGYLKVSIYKGNKVKTKKVHQLVAMAFLNHTPCGFKLVIDHINNDKLDNRVENLQVVTNRFNTKKSQYNYSSKYKGVCLTKSKKKWNAAIQINGKRIHLGYFNCELAAHLAYQNKLKEII